MISNGRAMKRYLLLLRKYVEYNLNGILMCIVWYQLYLAQRDIENAYELLLQDDSCWLSHLNSAKTQIDLIEPIIEYLMSNEFISHDIGLYIIQSIHDIRKNIDILIENSFN